MASPVNIEFRLRPIRLFLVSVQAINFTTYPDSELEASLFRINRFEYEPNYQACLQEINRRKADGVWAIKDSASMSIDWDKCEDVLDVVDVALELVGKIDLD